jgi:hypothetical protein
MRENAFPNCGLQWIHIKGSPHRLCLNFSTVHIQHPTERRSLYSHLVSKMLFTSQHVALFALAGLSAFTVAQTPENQTQIANPPVRVDNSPLVPGWRKEDNLAIVPLHPKARTGLIDPVLEEGLISIGTAIPSR